MLPFVDCLEGIYDHLVVQRPMVKELNVSLQLTLAVLYSFIGASLTKVPVVEDPSETNLALCKVAAQLREKNLQEQF